MSLYIDEQDINAISEQVWTEFLGLEIRRAEIPEGSAAPPVTSFVHIAGPVMCSVSVSLGADLALKVATRMFGTEPEATSPDDVKDAVGELVNMIGGNVKGLFPGPAQLSLPTVVEGVAYRVGVPGTRVLQELSFVCRGRYPFVVTIQVTTATRGDAEMIGRHPIHETRRTQE